MSLSCRQSLPKSPVASHPLSLIKHFNIRSPLLKVTAPKNQNNALTLKRKHQKHFSCDCSPKSTPLTVKKECLQDRNFQLNVPHKREPKVKLKQKTDCFNAAYVERFRLWKQSIDWVRYNIKVGIYALVGRIKTELNRPQLQNKAYQHSSPELLAINSWVRKLQRFTKLVPTFQGDRDTISKTLQLENNEIQRIGSLISQNILSRVPGEKLFGRTNTKVALTKFKQAINGLNSALCLLSRKISIEKQDKLIKDFMEQTSHSTKKGNSHRKVQNLLVLQQILKINARRCCILKDLASKIADIDLLKSNIEMSDRQIKQLQSLNLLGDLESAADAEIGKLAQVLQQIVHNTQFSTSKNQNKAKAKKILKTNGLYNKSKEQSKRGVRFASKTLKSCRPSIELLVDQIQPMLDLNKMEPTQQRQKFKKKVTMQYPINHELTLQLQDNEESKFHFYQPKLSKKNDKSRPKLKMALAFAHEVGQNEVNPTVKPDGKSAKSVFAKKKQKKPINEAGQTIPFNNRFVSIKSIKSMKSMRSVTSNGSYGCNKLFATNLKTQSQIKFHKILKKKISAIRPYRSKLFKLNEDFSNGQQSDILNFAAQLLETSEQNSSQNCVTSLNNLFNQESSHNLVNPQPVIKQLPITVTPIPNMTNIGRKVTLIFASPEQKKTIEKPQIAVFHRKYKKALVAKEHNDKKSNVLRSFASLCSQFKSGNQILQNKKVFYQHFQKLHQNKLIDQCLYQKYRKHFNFKKTLKNTLGRNKLTTQQEQQEAKKNNPYQSLISLRKQISSNWRLSQIDQYSHNLDQFKAELEQIDKTSQKALMDKYFFKIKYQADQKEVPTYHPTRGKMDYFQSRFHSQDEKLQQKAF